MSAVIELASHIVRCTIFVGLSYFTLSKYINSNGLLSKEQFQLVVGEGHEHTEKHWAMRSPRALSFLLQDNLRSQPLHVSFYILLCALYQFVTIHR